jgi:uncharacterized membrane protein
LNGVNKLFNHGGAMKKKVLLAGESWMSFTTHVKGFDTFYTSVYETGKEWLEKAVNKAGYEFVFLPNHEAMDSFPFTLKELKQYSCIILSDIGANTLLLPTATFNGSVKKPNRCNLLRQYVKDGGALLMVGGYMTFSGIDGKGKWHDTAVQDVLPVEVLSVDDRQEHCEGITPRTVDQNHPVLKGIPAKWPDVLGYNKTILKPGSELAATILGDPFLAFTTYGKGRTGVITTDCAPHWAPPEFCNWKYYNLLFGNILGYLIGGKV